MIDVKKQQLIRRLASEGLSQRQIAKEAEVSRVTVSSYLGDPARGSDIKKRRASAKPRRVSVLSKGNQELLKETYIETGYNCVLFSKFLFANPAKFGLPTDFNITVRSIRRYMNSIVDKPKKSSHKIINRFEVEVGQQLQIDFTHAKYTFAGDKVASNILVFEAVYTWSHKQFFWICPDMTQASWLRAVSECLLRFGVPREILCDNDKSLVISNDGKGNVRFHPDFIYFCKHFGLNPKACKPARPQTKGAVERGGYYLKKTGLTWARMSYPQLKSIEELNTAIQEWTQLCSDVDRTFDSVINNIQKYRSVKELYEYEKQFLSFVERDKFMLSLTCRMVTVNDEGFVCIHGERIRVPARFISKDLLVVVCAEGEYRISDHHGNTISEGYIAKDKLTTHRFDAVVPDSESVVETNVSSKCSTNKSVNDDCFQEYVLDDDDFV